MFTTAAGEVLYLQRGVSFAVCVQERGVSQPFSKFLSGLFSSRWRGKYTCQRDEPGLWINELTKEGNICLALILIMLHLAARATAKFLTISPGYLHLNRFSWHYVNPSAELKFSFSLSLGLHSVVCSVLPRSPLSAPLGYNSSTWNLSSPRFCLELGQRWWVVDFWDFHDKITLQMNLGLKENTSLSPMLPQVRAVLLRLCFQRDYAVVFLLFNDSAALDCSRRVRWELWG